MEYPILVILGVLAIGLVTVVIPVVLTTLSDHREPRSLPCPETGLPENVQVDAGLAARAAIFGRVRLAVQNCSRWPERQVCAQGCLVSVRSPDPTVASSDPGTESQRS